MCSGLERPGLPSGLRGPRPGARGLAETSMEDLRLSPTAFARSLKLSPDTPYAPWSCAVLWPRRGRPRGCRRASAQDLQASGALPEKRRADERCPSRPAGPMTGIAGAKCPMCVWQLPIAQPVLPSGSKQRLQGLGTQLSAQAVGDMPDQWSTGSSSEMSSPVPGAHGTLHPPVASRHNEAHGIRQRRSTNARGISHRLSAGCWAWLGSPSPASGHPLALRTRPGLAQGPGRHYRKSPHNQSPRARSCVTHTPAGQHQCPTT
ncbi:hypothetical protein PtB15_15B104 [Puccinia triticina]|nr:hypothetical protein PtB15_15B104 [Puccinia triticina]